MASEFQDKSIGAGIDELHGEDGGTPNKPHWEASLAGAEPCHLQPDSKARTL